MTLTERHALEKLLADVAGVVVRKNGKQGTEWWMDGYGDIVYTTPQLWRPLTDPGQMELVKAGLRKAGLMLNYCWDCDSHEWHLEGENNVYGESAESESLALALAIQQWKEQTHGHSDSTKSSD